MRVRVCLSKHVCITHMHKLRMHAHAHAHAHAPRAPPSSTPLTVPPLFTLPPLSLAGDPGTIMNSFSCTGTNEKTTCSQCVRARARAYVCVCVRARACAPPWGMFTCLRVYAALCTCLSAPTPSGDASSVNRDREREHMGCDRETAHAAHLLQAAKRIVHLVHGLVHHVHIIGRRVRDPSHTCQPRQPPWRRKRKRMRARESPGGG